MKMRTLNNTRPILLVAAGLLAASLACQANLGGPEAPAPAQPANPGQSGGLIDQLDGLQGEFTLIVTEADLNQFITQRLAEDENPVLQEPSVRLQGGLIVVHGVTRAGPLAANIQLGIQPAVDAEGNLTLEVVSADFGPLPLPESLRDSISALITEAFVGSIGSYATGFRLTTVAVTDGEMALVGELR